MDVRIENREPMRVAFVRHIGPYNQCEAAWGKLCGWAAPKGLFGPATVCLGVSYDDPEVTPEAHIRYDACVSIGPDVEGEGEIGVQELAGGPYAVVTHHGPYENLHKTYAAFYGEWLPASGREPRAAPSLEVYLNNPQNTAPADLRTEICVPLR